MEMSQHLSENFLTNVYPYIETKFRNQTSRHNYRTALNHICDFCTKDFFDITSEDVRKYRSAMIKGTLKNSRGQMFTKSGIDVRLASLRSIANSLEDTKRTLADIPAGYKSPFKEVPIDDTPDILEDRIPTVEDIDKILLHCDAQMRFVVCLVYRCCLTMGELLELSPEHFALDAENRLFIHFSPDVAPDRDVKVPDDIRREVESFLSSISPKAPRVLLNKRGSAHSKKTLHAAFQKVVLAADTSSVWSLKDIRNAGISHILYSGAKQEAVAEFLGVLPKWIKRYDRVVEGLDLQPNEFSIVRIIDKY